jgi:hypothetical protein
MKRQKRKGRLEVPDSEYKRKYEKPKYNKKENEIWH